MEMLSIKIRISIGAEVEAVCHTKISMIHHIRQQSGTTTLLLFLPHLSKEAARRRKLVITRGEILLKKRRNGRGSAKSARNSKRRKILHRRLADQFAKAPLKFSSLTQRPGIYRKSKKDTCRFSPMTSIHPSIESLTFLNLRRKS